MKNPLVLLCIVLIVTAGQGQNLPKGTSYKVSYQAGPTMNINRMNHFSAVLPNGDVVLFGGHGTGFVSLNTAEVYKAATNSFILDTMRYIHDYGAVSDLSDGTWLIAGGATDLGVAPGITGAEIFDPGTGKFTSCSSLVYPRCSTTGVRLANNNVLVAGGWYNQTSATYGELFNFSSKSFTATQPMVTPRSNVVAIATNDSGAVVFGGYYYYGGTSYESVEYYNPKTNSFSVLQARLFPNDSGWCTEGDVFQHPMSLQRMKNGNYLIYAWQLNPSQYTLGTFNPSTKSFARMTLSPPLPSADSIIFFRAPIVDTSKNLAYWFGVQANSIAWNVQLFVIDLANLTWQTSQFYMPHYFWSYGGMSLLNNGKILITGGTTSNDANTNFTPVDSTLLVSMSPSTGVNMDEAGNNLPTGYWLQQNFPNPFNPTTAMEYQIPRQSFVTLKVFDLLGRDVAVLVNEEKPAGRYSVTWDASGFSSGMYFYRLTAADYDQTRRMLLLK